MQIKLQLNHNKRQPYARLASAKQTHVRCVLTLSVPKDLVKIGYGSATYVP